MKISRSKLSYKRHCEWNKCIKSRLKGKYADYNKGTLSPDEFVKYCTNPDWKLKNIKTSLETLQGLAIDASQSAQGIKEAEKVDQQNPYIPGSRLYPPCTGGPGSSGSETQQGSQGTTEAQPSSNSNSNTPATGSANPI